MIRAGMTIAEAILQLTKGFRKMMGRNPDGLEKIKIQQEAVKRIEEVNKVVDMEGNVIDTSKGIIGGRQIQESPEFGAKIRETYDAAKGPGKGQEMVDALKSPGAKKSYEIIEKQLGVKLYGDETFEEILEIQRTGKHPRGEPKKIQRESLEDFVDDAGGTNPDDPRGIDDFIPDPDKKADGGRAGFKEGLLAKMMSGVKPDGGLFKSVFANRNAPFISGFNTAELFDLVSQISSLPGLAEGGRIGYKDGPDKPGRRKFMKIAGGILGALPFGGAKLLSKAAPVVSKAAEFTGPALDKIVDTVMSLGKFVSLKGKRVKEMVTKKKHEGVEVTEDIADQSYIIKKGDKEIYYKPGRMDETGGIEEDIIEVIEDTVTKKADGGIARMLGE